VISASLLGCSLVDLDTFDVSAATELSKWLGGVDKLALRYVYYRLYIYRCTAYLHRLFPLDRKTLSRRVRRRTLVLVNASAASGSQTVAAGSLSITSDFASPTQRT
jgi:hypothetical protein